MAKGRPSKSGKRRPCGKLIRSPKFDHGAEHVTIARARFASFHDGKATQQVHDPIGRAWAVGLLENHRFDPAVLRDAGRDYADRHFRYFPGASAVANYEGEDRRGSYDSREEDPAGEWYNRIDQMMRDAGRTAYLAAQSLCVDCYWTPDNNPPWLERLINERLAKAGVAVFGQLSIGGDMETARQAIYGLLALCEGSQRNTRSMAA